MKAYPPETSVCRDAQLAVAVVLLSPVRRGHPVLMAGDRELAVARAVGVGRERGCADREQTDRPAVAVDGARGDSGTLIRALESTRDNVLTRAARGCSHELPRRVQRRCGRRVGRQRHRARGRGQHHTHASHNDRHAARDTGPRHRIRPFDRLLVRPVRSNHNNHKADRGRRALASTTARAEVHSPVGGGRRERTAWADPSVVGGSGGSRAAPARTRRGFVSCYMPLRR